jgi:hypothetical protein
MPRHIVFLIHGMGLQPAGANDREKWFTPMVAALDKGWKSFAPLQGLQRERLIEYVPISYDEVFRNYLGKVSSHAQALSAFMPAGKLASFINELGDAGEAPDFFWDDVFDVLFYRYGADHFRQLHVTVSDQIAKAVQEHWDRQGNADTVFSMIAHSLGTAVAHGALNRLGGGKLGTSAAFKLGGPFFLKTYMTLANVSQVLWWGEHALYDATIVRPNMPTRPGYVDTFLNVRNAADPFPMPRRFAPVNWGRRYRELVVQHVHMLNVHDYCHYLCHPRVTGNFFQSLLGKVVFPVVALDETAQKFDDLPPLDDQAQRAKIRQVVSAFIVELRAAFDEGQAPLEGTVELVARVARLAWKLRKSVSAIASLP